MTNIKDLLAKAKLSEDANKFSCRLSGKYSFNVVYSEDNSKRVTINKALSEALGLSDKVQVACIPANGTLLLGDKLPENTGFTLNLSGKERKIIYNAEFVKHIINIFNLDFSDKVSNSYHDIRIDEVDGIKIASIILNENLLTNAEDDNDDVYDND